MNGGSVPNLHELQVLLYRLISAPEGVRAGLDAEAIRPDLEQIIVGDERLSAVERLGIYADAYFYRLLDALKEDFPSVVAVIGDDRFHNLITGYLLKFPPTEPSLAHAGRYLADYVENSSGFEQWPFLGDLARLERALLESFHAANAASLDQTAMQALPPAQWPALNLRFHPAVRLVRTRWRVDETVRAVAQNAGSLEPAAEEVTLIIWRQGSEVFHRVAEPFEAIALGLIVAGADFASICAAIADAASDHGSADLINRLLVRWLNDGLLLRQSDAEGGLTG